MLVMKPRIAMMATGTRTRRDPSTATSPRRGIFVVFEVGDPASVLVRDAIRGSRGLFWVGSLVNDCDCWERASSLGVGTLSSSPSVE